MEEKVKGELRDFIVASYLFGDSSRLPGDDVSLIAEGVIDSTGILELIEFLESHFGIEVTESETVPENLESVSNLTRFILAKTAVAGQAV
jgi:acyl carrier protein